MDLAIELEALEAVFEAVSVSGLSVNVPIYPSTAEDLSRRYVEATLCFKTSDDYPSSPPEVTLAASRGLGDQRQKELIDLLKLEANMLNGECMLGHLCEVIDLIGHHQPGSFREFQIHQMR